jgi:hypothetical protein
MKTEPKLWKSLSWIMPSSNQNVKARCLFGWQPDANGFCAPPRSKCESGFFRKEAGDNNNNNNNNKRHNTTNNNNNIY